MLSLISDKTLDLLSTFKQWWIYKVDIWQFSLFDYNHNGFMAVYILRPHAAGLDISLEKNCNIFQTTRFSHTMIFYKLNDYYKISDIYINHNNCSGDMLIT